MLKLLAVITLLAACATEIPDAPRVLIKSFDERPEYEKGLAVWQDLGFQLDDGSGIYDRCPRTWIAQGMIDCTIHVGIVREDNLVERYGSSGLADRATGTIIIDSRYTDRLLVHVVAHELGHVIFNRGDHLPDGVQGVMEQGTAEVEMSDNDREWACTAGWCP